MNNNMNNNMNNHMNNLTFAHKLGNNAHVENKWELGLELWEYHHGPHIISTCHLVPVHRDKVTWACHLGTVGLGPLYIERHGVPEVVYQCQNTGAVYWNEDISGDLAVIPAGMNEYEIVLRSPEGVILWEKFSHRERCEVAAKELIQAYGLKLDEQGGKIQLEISWR